MKVYEIQVHGHFEQKLNTGNYQSATFGTGLTLKVELEEGESGVEKYRELMKVIKTEIDAEIWKQIGEYKKLAEKHKK